MKFIILGIIQGLTEFLPVSSSGHLVLAEKLFGVHDYQLLIILVCHFGTLLSMFVYFFKDIIGVFKKLGLIGHIIWVSVITFIIAKSGQKFFESLFSSARAVSVALCVTGAILLIASRFQNGKRSLNSMDIRDSSLLGLMQGIAVIPGISRAGMTISSLFFRNIERDSAFKFSFLAGMPAIAGAFILQIKDAGAIPAEVRGHLILACAASFVTGLAALAILRSIINQAKFHWFGYYCIAAGVLSFIFIK
jgi:undecaprenyl-diphosphatase